MTANYMVLANFRTEFPMFSAVSDAYVNAKINEAAEFCDHKFWGTKLYRAHGYYIAHLLTIFPETGNAMSGIAVQSASGDGLTINFGNNTVDSLKRTVYGQQFIRLRKSKGPMARFFQGGKHG